MFSATNFASTSGFLISNIFKLTSKSNFLLNSFLNFSISWPFFPIISPGLPEYIVTLALPAGLSITTLLTAFHNGKDI